MAIRLLLAEDHTSLRDHLVQYLSEFGIQCAPADSVSEAVRMVDDQAVDGVMVDLLLQGRLSLPVINRAFKYDVPVLIHTAFDRNAVSRQVGPAFERCTLVQKPHELSNLRSHIVYMVRKGSAVNGG